MKPESWLRECALLPVVLLLFKLWISLLRYLLFIYLLAQLCLLFSSIVRVSKNMINLEGHLIM